MPLFLTILVETCGSIKGLNINKEYLKINQFADDTTIFLDGSESSLQSALNVLEIFGTYSSLKVNKEKTQIVWIGSKKGNTQKLCQHANLKWEINTFRVLGITFSVNLNDMPSLNNDTITTDVERTLVPWRQQKLTPIGKICILKTFIIPRLTTLFMTIPRPTPWTFKSLNKLFYSFIWDYKPDKISRAKLTQSYPRGGLKMIDVDAFTTSLKISWIKRLLSNDTPVWNTLGLHCIKNPIRLRYFGSIRPKNLAQNITNTVWKEALQSWACLLCVNSPDENRKFSSPVWYNPRISKKNFFCHNGSIRASYL